MDACREVGPLLECIWRPHVCVLVGMIHRAGKMEGGRIDEVRGV